MFEDFNWVDPLNLDKRGGMVKKLYPLINPLGAVKQARDQAKDARRAQEQMVADAAAYNSANSIGKKKGGSVKAKSKTKPKETKARGIAKDTKPVKTFARGGGVESRGKTRGRFI